MLNIKEKRVIHSFRWFKTNAGKWVYRTSMEYPARCYKIKISKPIKKQRLVPMPHVLDDNGNKIKIGGGFKREKRTKETIPKFEEFDSPTKNFCDNQLESYLTMQGEGYEFFTKQPVGYKLMNFKI